MNTSRQQGFTLIELMIVVLILAILATIAYPSYETYVRNTRREGVRADLTITAQTLERQYAQKHKFPDSAADVPAGTIEENPYFNIRYEKADGDDFTLIAEANPQSNAREDSFMKLNGSGIITLCKKSEPTECELYR